MTEYRRRKGRDAWHWMRKCRWWPKRDFTPQVSDTRPKSGELCNECQAKERRHGGR